MPALTTKALKGNVISQSERPILLDNLKCTGEEKSLINCNLRMEKCKHHHSAGVVYTGTLLVHAACSIFNYMYVHVLKGTEILR